MPFLGKTPTKFLDANVNIDGGTIDGTTIGATSAAAATVSTFTSTGIDDNATSTKLTVADSAITTGSIDQLIVAHSTDGGGIRIDSTNSTNTGSLRFGDDLDNYIGALEYNHTSNAMSVYVNNATRMTIDSSGNVGIGTTSPSTYSNASELVVDTGLAGGITVVSDSTSGGYGALFFADGTTGDEQYRGFFQYNHNNSGTDEMLIGTAGATRMTIDSSGNVGIGTTSPGSKFHVKVATDENIKFLTGGSGDTRISAVNDANSANTQLSIQGSPLLFRASGGVEAARIDSSGNVGIGTTSPNTIIGNVSGSATGLAVESAVPVFALKDTSASDDISYIYQSTDDMRFLNYAGGAMTFRRGSGGTSSMIIDSSGQVGINNDSPSAILHTDCGAPSSSDKTLALFQAQSSRQIGFVWDDSASTLGIANFGTQSLAFHVGGNSSEKMRITNGNKAGILTTDPQAEWVVSNISNERNIEMGYSAGTAANYIQSYDRTASAYYDLELYFSELMLHTGNTERVRIDSVGRLLVGKSAVSNTTSGYFLEAGTGGYASFVNTATGSSNRNILCNRQSGDGTAIELRRANVIVGSISVTSSATAYNTSSDQRLKENIVDAPAGNIDAIRVRSFDWKADGTHQTHGMIAQELVDVAPEAVAQGETEDDMWGVDYSKLVPMMIKEIQDLKAEVAALKGA